MKFKKIKLLTATLTTVAPIAYSMSCNSSNESIDSKFKIEFNEQTKLNELHIQWTLPDTFNFWQEVSTNDENDESLEVVYYQNNEIMLTPKQKNQYFKNEKALSNIAKQILSNNLFSDNYYKLGKFYFNATNDYYTLSDRYHDHKAEYNNFLVNHLKIDNAIHHNLYELVSSFTQTTQAYSFKDRGSVKYEWHGMPTSYLSENFYFTKNIYHDWELGSLFRPAFKETLNSYYSSWNSGYEDSSIFNKIDNGTFTRFENNSTNIYFYHNYTIPFPDSTYAIKVNDINYLSYRYLK